MKRIDEILCQVDDTIGMKRFLPIVEDAKQAARLLRTALVRDFVVNSGIVQKHLNCFIDIVDPSFFYRLGVMVTTFPESKSLLYNREKDLLAEVLFAISSVSCVEQCRTFVLGGLFQEHV